MEYKHTSWTPGLQALNISGFMKPLAISLFKDENYYGKSNGSF
jgi:hypothetical protein